MGTQKQVWVPLYIERGKEQETTKNDPWVPTPPQFPKTPSGRLKVHVSCIKAIENQSCLEQLMPECATSHQC